MDLNAALRSHRSQESWSWELLDNDDRFIGDFAGVVSGGLTANVAAPIRTGGTLVWKGQSQPQWLGFRVRPVYRATLVDGTQIEWPYGVYIPATPEPEYNGMSITGNVEFYDKLLVLSEDAVDTTFTLAAGTVATTAIRNIIEGAGETKHSIVDSTATLATSLAWPTGTSKLKIINDLLADTLNYFSLFCDLAGYYRAEPYVAPESRGSMWNFMDGETSIYQPKFSHKQDYFGKPNKVILISQGSGDTEALTATATNTDVTDPLAYGGIRGTRWVTVTEEGVDAASQTILNDLALRRLRSLAEVSSTYQLKHALVPLDLNALVTFKNAMEGIDTKGVVQEMEIPCVTGKSTQVTTTIREVKG